MLGKSTRVVIPFFFSKTITSPVAAFTESFVDGDGFVLFLKNGDTIISTYAAKGLDKGIFKEGMKEIYEVNYETVEGVTPTKALELCKYLKEEVPKVIVADHLQDKFGGTKSFDWAIEDNSGTSSTAPGFQIIGTSEEK